MSTLYISDLSPFGARLRLVLSLTGQTVAIAPPPGGAGSPAMHAITPFGRIPAFQTDTRVVVESLALMEYFAEMTPASKLIFIDAAQRAAMRSIMLLFDNSVLVRLQPVFMQLRETKPNIETITAGFVEASIEMSKLAGLLDTGDFAIGEQLSLADCAIVPFAFLIERLTGMFKVASPFQEHNRWAAWWKRSQNVPEVAQLGVQMADAFARFAAARSSGSASNG